MAFLFRRRKKKIPIDQQHLDSLPKEIAEACRLLQENNPTLTDLWLNAKKIGNEEAKALARAMRTNQTLQWLNLLGNQIGSDGAKALARSLKTNTTLQELCLSGNQIGDDGNNAIVAALASSNNRNLKNIWLGSHCDRSTAVKFVHSLMEQKFPNLQSIDFVQLNQYLPELRVPQEYADKDNKEILSFLRERWESGEEALAVTKVIVTGPGEAGKTCLVSRLVRDEYPGSPPPMTNGMLEERIVDDSGLELVFYDFGGQPIYTTTHQLFLRSRAVFVVVWDNRQTDTPFHRYAEDILDISPNARIIFVTTKSDMGHASLSSDEVKDLQERYGQNFSGYVHTSAQAGTGATKLTEKIKNVAKLVMDSIGSAVGINDMLVPSSYVHLRKCLEQLRKSGKFFLTREEWNSYADDAKINGEGRAERALTLFHEIGEVLCLPTGEIILDPPELAQVLARVVTNDKRYVQNARGGYLRHCELGSVWTGYPQVLWNGFLELIHECEVGFPICDDDGEDYNATLIPAMLSHSSRAMKSHVRELVVDHRALKQNPCIEIELSTQSRCLWPKLQSKLQGLAMIGGWWRNGGVVAEAFPSAGGRKKLRSFGMVEWIGAERVLLIKTHGQGRLLQSRILQALSSCLEEIHGAELVRLDVMCASRLNNSPCCGSWGIEALRDCRQKAAICPKCGVACDVDKIADWLFAFANQRQHALDLDERRVSGLENAEDRGRDSRTDISDSLQYLRCLLEKHANSPELIAYLLLAHQRKMLTIGCSTDGRLLLRALWLMYMTDDGLRAYPFCPHMEYEEIRVDGQLGVSVVAETGRMGSNACRTELKSIVEAIHARLEILPPVYEGRFMGVVWAGQDKQCVYNIQRITLDNFRSVKIPEIGWVWVHKEYVEDFKAVQISYVRKLKRKVIGCIADDSAAFISHTGQDPAAGNFAAHLHDKLEDQDMLHFYDGLSIEPGEEWKERIRSEVEKCAVFVAILSPTYFQRYWCMHELDLAFRHGRHIFPVYYGPHGRKDLPSDKDEFISHFAEEERADQDELERWWNNVRRLPEKHDIRMSSFAYKKDAEVLLKNFVVRELRKLLEQKTPTTKEEHR